MTDDTHVYCTQCQHFRTDDEYLPYCPFEGECDIWNCEDSRPFKDRPRYKGKEEKKGGGKIVRGCKEHISDRPKAWR